MKYLNKHSSTLAVLALSLTGTGCQTTAHQYAGTQRNDSEVAVLRNVSVVGTEGHKPNIVLNVWKINGAPPKSDLAMTHAWGVLPGKQEVSVILSLINEFPVSIMRFEGAYAIPFDAEPGYVYEFFALSNNRAAPSQVCALRIKKEKWPVELSENMKMNEDVRIAGCGTPKKPVESYRMLQQNTFPEIKE